ncbi:hypothetical protein RchiOBHm_Chr5g0044081 [Rosa chinensis]|uniref:Uncharacterized protein n=1 Tax=Rosa chinensis TaxID=74649 RepID=A0A2P6QDH4_ROSCH|nr:hypothetical protein RchiOBHm_Chr5g0044081 [Rosa chinensis]
MCFSTKNHQSSISQNQLWRNSVAAAYALPGMGIISPLCSYTAGHLAFQICQQMKAMW